MQCPTFASSKISRRVFSDSPDIPETMDGAEMLRKGIPSSWWDQNIYPKAAVWKEKTHPRDSIGKHGLSTAGRSMKENTAWRLNAGVQVDFWVG